MSTYLIAIVSVFAFWNIGFVYAALRLRNDIADVLWGLGFGVAVLAASVARSSQATIGPREIVIAVCVALWGLRLSLHIGRRFRAHAVEDIRYVNMRKGWGQTWLWKAYVRVFTLQPVIALLIVSPALWAIRHSPRELTGLCFIGLVTWVVGFLFESISDSQLRRFIKEPCNKDRIMQSGLWRFSRHPNYFGEVVQWWGVYLMAAELQSWWLIISPITITFFILKVSGVPLLEQIMKDRPGFQAYAKRTSIFVPWAPKTPNE